MNDWPRLDFVADRGTIETLHLLLQLIGKLPLRLLPWINHGWHVALRVTPRGVATRMLQDSDRHFTVELDFRDGAIRIECYRGSQLSLPIVGLTIAQVHGALTEGLAELALPAPLYGAPTKLRILFRFATTFARANGMPRRPVACTASFCSRTDVSTLFAHCTGASLLRATCSGAALIWR